MNGATEATLAELLATAQAMNINLNKLNSLVGRMNTGGGSGGGLGGIAATASSIASINPIAKALSVGMNMLSGLMAGLGSIVGKVVGTFTVLVGNMFDFAKAAANGTATLSLFYDTIFKGIPILGTLSSIFADIIRYSEGLLTSYQNITQVGASFGGNLFEMANAAARAYMTVSEFSQVINKNSDIFATMAGGVQSGINKFVDANAALMGPDSPYSKGILGLGVTSQQASEYLAGVIRSQGMMGRQQSATSGELAKFTNEYIFQLDTLSKLTGKRKDQLDAEIKKAEEEQLWQLTLDSMTVPEQERAKMMLTIAQGLNGQAAVDQLKAQFRGLNAPVNDLTQNFAIATKGASLNGTAMLDLLKGNRSLEEVSKLMYKSQFGLSREVLSTQESIGQLGQAAGVGSQLYTQEQLKTGRIVKQFGGDFDKVMAAIKKEQEKQGKGNAQQLATAEQNIKIFGSRLMQIFTTFIEPIVGPLIGFADAVIKTVSTFVASDGVIAQFNKIKNWFGTAFTDLQAAYKEGGFKGLFSKLGEKLGEAFNNTKEFLTPLWEGIKPALLQVWDTILKPAFLDLLDLMWGAFKEWAFGPSAKTLQEQGQKNKATKVAAKVDEKFYENQAVQQLADQGNVNATNQQIKDLAKQIKEQTEAEARREQARENARAQGALPAVRHSGTVGMTGNWWEKSDATLNVQAGESVVTQSQMEQIVNTASQSGMAQSIQQLNSLTAQMLAVMKQTAENTKRTYDATKALNGDLFQIA
jgi:hypothetical protein